ncbi:serine hydrolase domain-containing protein [Asticcacaulis excentricus]|uniref:Beta-lactamase n=1 Tax=Asticcacaulis excentricus (strain ATCC 15261 / DSM 4724 / KCTC 12464 / NCIMB 9791 / VKM B-1370 / CB 48) TaxID=573065 RepID=E8RMT5_ASTEC|nr:serine hydrolase [Asticcacaulis excentricus]ADU13966.1 beta-lactamase [Asticcacaulis excentricus CB 48]
MMTRRQMQTLMTAFGLMAGTGALAADSPFYGRWTGVLEAGMVRLTLRLEIDAKGATLFSVDQGNARIPASSASIEDERIKLTFAAIKATFEGVLTDERHVDGTFTQGAPLPLRFTRGEVAEAAPEAVHPPLTRELLNDKRLAAYTPAMAAAWARGAQTEIFAAGARSSDDEIAVQMEDQWHWGSITKSMTATLCARLVDAGVLKWTTKVGDVLDENGRPVPTAYRDATLLHLLSHRAGLQPNLDGINTVFYSRDPLPDPRAERRKWALTALKQKPVGPVGAQNVYANNGYIIAGTLLEQLTGKSWETLIQAELFTPLGITSAGFGAPGRPGQVDQPLGHAVNGHTRKPLPVGPGRPTDNPVALGPAGRVHMSMSDMLTYLQAHRDRPVNLLKSESWDALHTPHFGDDYALGWVVRPDGTLWHNGSNTFWYAEVLVDTRSGSVAAACANDAASDTQVAVGQVLTSARQAAKASA